MPRGPETSKSASKHRDRLHPPTQSGKLKTQFLLFKSMNGIRKIQNMREIASHSITQSSPANPALKRRKVTHVPATRGGREPKMLKMRPVPTTIRISCELTGKKASIDRRMAADSQIKGGATSDARSAAVRWRLSTRFVTRCVRKTGQPLRMLIRPPSARRSSALAGQHPQAPIGPVCRNCPCRDQGRDHCRWRESASTRSHRRQSAWPL